MGLGIVVIVIFLVIWIVSNVVRAQQDAAQAARRPPSRPMGAAPPQGQRGNSDIDRFLQEIDRLRRKGQQEPAAERRGTPASTSSAATPVESQRTRDRQPARRAQPERKRPPVADRKPSKVEPAPKPEALAPAPIVELAQPVVSRLEQKLRDVPAPLKIAAVSRPERPAQAGAAMSPALQMLQTLFKTQQGAGVAVLLHEILSPPKSRR